MTVSTIKVTITPPWWASGYIYACGVFAALHGVEPDVDKIAATLVKHTKLAVL